MLRGGPSSEYDVSLKSGGAVLAHLPEKYHGLDIFIDKQGLWHQHGAPIYPHKLLQSVDVVFNALHGEYGEDGTLQHLLDSFKVPYSGSGRFASALSMNKAFAKERLAKEGIKTPYFRILRQEEHLSLSKLASELYRTFPQPSVIKPLAKGSSVGISLAGTQDELVSALEHGFSIADVLLIEEFIAGKEATCGVIDNFRGEKHYALLPVEVIPPKESKFFDYYAKYSGESRIHAPGNFTRAEKEGIEKVAKKVHNVLDLRHYSSSDFIVHPKRGIYFLEVDTLPSLTNESLFPKALASVGSSLPHFLEHVITLALKR